MTKRLGTHYSISTSLSMLSDAKLQKLLGQTNLSTGWGHNGVIEIDGHQVFVKMIPLGKREVQNAYSTKNHYSMPAWYNYGVGSAGFGAFRELAAHIKTTNWVQAGDFNQVPLLHHHRILKVPSMNRDLTGLDDYIAQWNGSKTIKQYIVDRSRCEYHLVLFLECLTPFTDWIVTKPAKLKSMFGKAIKGVQYLNKHGLTHFDAHLQNWLTDGTELYLGDFGLLLDRDIELTAAEHEFFLSHRHYDLAQVVSTVADGVLLSYFQLGKEEQDAINTKLNQSPEDFSRFLRLLVEHALVLHKEKAIVLPQVLRNHILKYQPIIALKHEFFTKLRSGKKASNLYPEKKLTKLLLQQNLV